MQHHTYTPAPRAVEILTDLVDAGPTPAYALPLVNNATPVSAGQVKLLERTSTLWGELARRNKLPYQPLGYGQLFNDARLFDGGNGEMNWIVQPSDAAHEHQSVEDELTNGRVIVPRAQRAELEAWRDAGIRPPVIFVAHEVPTDVTDEIIAQHGTPDGAPLTPEQSRELIGPPPEPRSVADHAERLSNRTVQMGKAAKIAALGAGALIAAPVLAAGAAAATVTAAVVDPVVIGAFPAGPRRVGTPTFYAVLTRWDW